MSSTSSTEWVDGLENTSFFTKRCDRLSGRLA